MSRSIHRTRHFFLRATPTDLSAHTNRETRTSETPTPAGVASKLVSLFDAPLPASKMSNLVQAAQRVSGGRIDESNANLVAQTVTKLIFASPEFQFC